jgi:hypothetical protein
VVFDSLDHKPLGRASVFVVGTALAAITDAAGRYAIDSVPEGSYHIAIESATLDTMGLTPNPRPAVVRAGAVDTVNLFVPSLTTLLDAMCPASRAAGGESILVGSVHNAGTRAPIDSATVTLMHAYRVTDILQHAKGIQLVYPDSGGPPIVQMGRSRFSDLIHTGLCPVEFFVDGVPFDMQNSPDIHLHPGDIEAIEVYDGASTIPPQYQSGSAACGAVVIWLKHGPS